MLSNDERPSSDHSTVGDQCCTAIEIQPPHADRFRLAFALDLRFDDPEGQSCSDFSRAMPQCPIQQFPSPLSDERYSIAGLVSLLSTSIRTDAFARGISLRSLQIEAALGHEQVVNRSGMMKVTVTLDADAPRPAVEAPLAHWCTLLSECIRAYAAGLELVPRLGDRLGRPSPPRWRAVKPDPSQTEGGAR